MVTTRLGSVRVRLTLWYVGVVGVILALYAIGVFAFVRSSLIRALDEQLHQDFEVAETLLERTAGGGIELRRWPHAGDESADDRGTEVQDGRRVVLRVPDFRRIADEPATPSAGAAYWSRVDGAR